MSTSTAQTQAPPRLVRSRETSLRSPASRSLAATVPVTGGLGLGVIAVSFAMERTATDTVWADAVFWLGFVLMVAPITWRLLGKRAARGERLLLVFSLGALSYGIKVLRDPLMFVMSDEFTHLNASQRIIATHSLFPQVTVSGAPVAAGYPGLHIAAVIVHDISGLSLFVSALIVIGLARVLIVLALFHLFERMSGSARIAGLGAALFAANSNFIFWSAQFSYESLALPLFAATLFLIVMRAEHQNRRLPFTLSIALLTMAIAATHHVTTYALSITLWVMSLMSLRRRWRKWRAVGLASFATFLSALWFVVVARGTENYLSFIFGEALNTTLHVAEQHSVHAPFSASTSSLQTPLSEEVIAVLGVMLVAVGIMVTLLGSRRIPALRSALGILLLIAGVACVAIYPLRALPGTWETTNRAQEFLFIGVSFVLAVGLAQISEARMASWKARVMLTTGLLVILCGGVIEGWPAPLRLSQPLLVKAGHSTISPQGLEASSWATSTLPRDSVYVGDQATAQELSVDGAHFTYFGAEGSVYAQVLQSSVFPAWQQNLLRNSRVNYLLVDDRRIANNDQAAYFFQPARDPSGGAGYFSAAVREKFAALPSVSRVSDSGDIVIYDVSSFLHPPPSCAAVGLPSIVDGLTCKRPSGSLTSIGAGSIATLPGVRVRYLGSTAQSLADGLLVNVRLQIQNQLARRIRSLSEPGGVYLKIGGDTLQPLSVVPYRKDNFGRYSSVPASSSTEGSLSFIVRTARAIAQVGRGDGRLYLPAPGPHGSRDVALIRIGRSKLIR